jgi:hypothetical protein
MTYTIHWDWAYIYFLQTRDIILFSLSQFYSNQNEQNEMVFEQISACFPDYAQRNRIATVEKISILRIL